MAEVSSISPRAQLYLETHASRIRQVAEILGIPPMAIAGVFAEEITVGRMDLGKRFTKIGDGPHFH